MYEFSSKMPMLDQITEDLHSFGTLDCIKQNVHKCYHVLDSGRNIF